LLRRDRGPFLNRSFGNDAVPFGRQQSTIDDLDLALFDDQRAGRAASPSAGVSPAEAQAATTASSNGRATRESYAWTRRPPGTDECTCLVGFK
jgi:hypothetical protein